MVIVYISSRCGWVSIDSCWLNVVGVLCCRLCGMNSRLLIRVIMFSVVMVRKVVC